MSHQDIHLTGLSDGSREKDGDDDKEAESSEDGRSHSTGDSHEVGTGSLERLRRGVVWVCDQVGLFLNNVSFLLSRREIGRLTLERCGGMPSKDILLCIPGAVKK